MIGWSVWFSMHRYEGGTAAEDGGLKADSGLRMADTAPEYASHSARRTRTDIG
jgi:hypothetical protein